MRDTSHGTLIGAIRQAVEEWRHRMNWSRETVCAEFVEAFKKTERPNAWNIEFSNHHDLIQRQKNDADKIMRWLDDVNKDNNLLSANFARVMLAAMPMDLRMSCLNAICSPLGLVVRGSEQSNSSAFNATSHLVNIAREASEAQSAVASLIDGATQEELVKADRELAEAEEALRRARADVRQHMTVKA